MEQNLRYFQIIQKFQLTKSRKSFKTLQSMARKAAIEDNIPIPSRCNVKSYGLLIDLVSTVRVLAPGQSFVVDNADGRERALKMGLQLDVPLTSRRIEYGRYRIWRKEKE